MRYAVVALVLGFLAPSPLSVSTPDECPAWKQISGQCGIRNNNNEVIIDGTQRENSSNPNPVDNWAPNPNVPWVAPPTPEEELAECLLSWDDYIGCFEALDRDEPADEEDTASMPAVTINDVARFAPNGTVIAGEPQNVGVAGLPTNFVATASVHSVNGELFGFPVTVRFTPVAFDFTYGDGASTTTASGGQSWDDLGQAQFTPTPTSHTYADRGTYAASVDVRYAADVDFGIGWFPIAGEVTAAGQAQQIRIFEAHTALVAHTCQQSPSSPGC